MRKMFTICTKSNKKLHERNNNKTEYNIKIFKFFFFLIIIYLLIVKCPNVLSSKLTKFSLLHDYLCTDAKIMHCALILVIQIKWL